MVSVGQTDFLRPLTGASASIRDEALDGQRLSERYPLQGTAGEHAHSLDLASLPGDALRLAFQSVPQTTESLRLALLPQAQ